MLIGMVMSMEGHDFRKDIFVSIFSDIIGFVWNEMKIILNKIIFVENKFFCLHHFHEQPRAFKPKKYWSSL